MNTWNIKTTEQVDKFLEKLSIGQQTKVTSIFLLFREYGMTLPTKLRVTGEKRTHFSVYARKYRHRGTWYC